VGRVGRKRARRRAPWAARPGAFGRRGRGQLESPGLAAGIARRGAGAEPRARSGHRGRQRLSRRVGRGCPGPLPAGGADRADPQHGGRGRVRRRARARAARRGRPGLADGRRHGPRARRARGDARRPRPPPRHAARAAGQPGGLDRRPRAPDEHPARQAARARGGAPRGRGHRVRPDPLRLLRVRPRGRRRVPAPRPAAGGLLPVERRLRVHHPAAARPGRAAVPGQRRRAQDPGVRVDGRRPGRPVLLRGAQQGLDAQVRPGARPGRARPVRRGDAAPLGPHLRPVRPARSAAGRPGRRARRRRPDPAAAHRRDPGRGRAAGPG